MRDPNAENTIEVDEVGWKTLKLRQIVPYVILIILVYQKFEVRSTSDFMVLFVIFSKKSQTKYTYKYY